MISLLKRGLKLLIARKHRFLFFLVQNLIRFCWTLLHHQETIHWQHWKQTVWYCTRASAEKFPEGRGLIERPKPRNSINKPGSLLSILSVAGLWKHRACTQGTPKGNVASRALRKSEDLFWEKQPFPGKCLPF